MSDEFDPDERFSLEMEPEDAVDAVLRGQGATDEDSEEPEAEQ